jgi:hypothetical protein
MIVRPASTKDLDEIVRLAQEFYGTSEYGTLLGAPLNLEKVTAAFALCLTAGAAFVVESEVDWHLLGMIGLLRDEHPYTDLKGAFETVWFVSPESRTTLLVGPRLEQRAREWALQAGLDYLTMTAPAGSRVGHFLQGRGYTAVETTFHLRLR